MDKDPNTPTTARFDYMRLIALVIITVLTFYVIGQTAWNPPLMKEQLWVSLVTAIAMTNFGMAMNYFLGSSKGSSDRAAQTAAASEQPTVNTAGGDLNVNTNTGADQKPAPVPVAATQEGGGPGGGTARSQPIAKFPT